MIIYGKINVYYRSGGIIIDIIVTLRDGMIRISPSFYNTEEEIYLFLNAL